MRLLALDQSSKITGWAIFDNGKLEQYGKFDSGDIELPARLTYIRNRIQDIIALQEIDEVVLEDIQLQNTVGNNVVTYKALAEVIGVITQLLNEMRVPHTLIHSSTWKSALSIKGRNRPEQKRAAQQYVVNTYHMDKKKPTQDECDAICIGIAHTQNHQESAW